jgi:hypothetical protein
MNNDSILSNYSSVLSNSTEEQVTVDSTSGVILLSIKIFIIFATIFLNLIIVFIVIFMTKKKTYTNILFMSMALADFMVGLVSLTSMTIFTWNGYWPLGYSACVFWIINDFSCCVISLLDMVLICLHRLRQIVQPLKTDENLTKFRCFLILFIWFLSYVPWTISALIITHKNFVIESCYYMYSFVYVLLADLGAFILPIVVLVILNILTFVALMHKAKRFPSKKNKNTVQPKIKMSRNGSLTGVTNIPDSTVNRTIGESNAMTTNTNTSSSGQTFQISKEKKAFLCILVVTVTLILCWCIFFTTWPMLAYCDTCVNLLLYEIGYWTAYFHSTLNPIILLVFHQNFRHQFLRIFRCLFNLKKNA